MNTGGKLYFPGSSDRIDQLQYLSVVDGKQNTFLGQECGNKFPGEFNVFSGYRSGQESRKISTSLFSGAKSGQNAQRIQDTVMVGYEAGQSSSDSNSNVLIGAYSGRGLKRSRFNVCVGHRAMAGAVSSVQNTSVGAYSAMSSHGLANSVTIGFYSGEHLRGLNNTYTGAFSGANANSYDSTVIGFRAGQHLSGNSVTAMGVSVLENGIGVNDSVAIGAFVGQNVQNSANLVIIGTKALQSAVSAHNVVAIGSMVARDAVTVEDTVILGSGAAFGVGGNITRSYISGIDAAAHVTGDIIDSTVVGYAAADVAQSLVGTVAMGKDVLGGATGVITDSVAIGTGAGASVTGFMTNSTLVGFGVADSLTTIIDTVAIGKDALGGTTGTTSASVIVGTEAGSSSGTITDTTLVGYKAADTITSIEGSVGIGHKVFGETTGPVINSVSIGAYAAYTVLAMNSTVVIGHSAAFSMDSMEECTLIGSGVASSGLTFQGITAIGNKAMENTSRGDYSTAVGSYCFGGEPSQGRYNSFLGYYCGSAAQGDNNTGMGANMGLEFTGNNNVMIGANSVTSAYGYATLNNTVLIGNNIQPATLTSCIAIGNNIVPYINSQDCILIGSDIATDASMQSKQFFVSLSGTRLMLVNEDDAMFYCPGATPGSETVAAYPFDDDSAWSGGMVVAQGGLTMYNGIKLYGSSGSVYAQNRLVAGATEYTSAMASQRLYIDGDGKITGFLEKGGGTFDIEHPTDATKRLIHSFVEGPRCDLIYRGAVTLVDGMATVDIDTQCVTDPECAMTPGTFQALVANPDMYLQNQTGFDRVRGSITRGTLQIECENRASTDRVSWMVVGERQDTLIRSWGKTNGNGYLKTEYTPT